MNTASQDVTEHTLKGVRRAAIWTIIVSLVAAAGVGIATIVSGEFGDLEGKILLTTLVVAAFAILALCHLAIITKAVRVLGWIGIGTSALSLTTAIVLIWWDWNAFGINGPSDLYMGISRTFTISALAAVSLAHANLMLLLATAPIRWMRVALSINLVLIAIIPALLIPVILTDGNFPPQEFSDLYWKTFGVVLILDALGTVSLPITNLILRSQRRASALSTEPNSVTVTVRNDDAAWLVDEARAGNSTPADIVEDLIRKARKS